MSISACKSLIVALVILSLCTAQIKGQKNGCTPGSCARCVLKSENDGIRVCEVCMNKGITLDDAKFSDCTGNSLLDDCLASKVVNDKPQCVTCKDGF